MNQELKELASAYILQEKKYNHFHHLSKQLRESKAPVEEREEAFRKIRSTVVRMDVIRSEALEKGFKGAVWFDAIDQLSLYDDMERSISGVKHQIGKTEIEISVDIHEDDNEVYCASVHCFYPDTNRNEMMVEWTFFEGKDKEEVFQTAESMVEFLSGVAGKYDSSVVPTVHKFEGWFE